MGQTYQNKKSQIVALIFYSFPINFSYVILALLTLLKSSSNLSTGTCVQKEKEEKKK